VVNDSGGVILRSLISIKYKIKQMYGNKFSWNLFPN